MNATNALNFTLIRPPRYNRNIVESDVKHHKTNQYIYL
jgi:hypothetical protein